MYFKLHAVYNSKGGIVAAFKGAALSWDLFQGFGAGALRTPFYTDLAAEGLVSAREFFNLLEKRDVHLDEPCQISCDLALSQPVQMCIGFESSGAPSEGGDLGFGSSFQLHRGEERGRFDDSDGEEEERTSGSPTGPIDVDAAYFLEWKDVVRTKREIPVNPSQVVDIGEWEAGYNQRSLDPVHTQLIIDAMTTAYSQASKTYGLPTLLRLAPLGLEKPKPWVRAQRMKPENWKDELAGQYYYYAVVGQHNVAAARTLLGTDVAVRYNFERWPARMVYFSDADFEGYFLVSAEDNKKDLKAPPRQQKLSMTDIRWCWKEKGYPRVVMGNPSGKQAQVESWRWFCEDALQKMPYNHLWTLADDKTEQGISKQNAALRSYFPLAMAGESLWKMGMEFFKKWETGRLLAPEGAKWIAKKKKVKGVKGGVSHIENDKTGRKEVVYNIPVEARQKKGKKEKESGDWFVQVNELDLHCWKSMEALTDNEKCRLLKKVLNCEVVWVQTDSSLLAKQGKLGMQEAVHLVKCDRILVRLWNYYQFKYENRPDSEWTRSYPFLRKREAILAQFKSQGLDAALWDGSKKLVGDSSLFRDCPPFMGCEDDKSIKATEKLVLDKKLSIDWKNKVLSMLTCSRSKSMDVALAEGMMHIRWQDSGDVTSIAPFGVDPLEAQMKVVELEKAVGITKCDDLRDNTSVVYDTRLEAGDAAAVGAHVKVTSIDVSEMPFEPSEWPLVIPVRDRKAYKDMEWNPAQLAHLLEFVCKKGEGVMFLRKAHAQVVWEALKGGRNIIALEGNSELLQYTLNFLKGELRVASYSALIDTDEEATTGVVFDTNVPEEDSDTKEFALNYLPAPVLPPPGSSTAGASSTQATPATPVRRSTLGKTPSKLLAKLTPRTVAPPRLRPGSAVLPEHPSWKDESIHFEGHDHTRSSEADWGQDMIWHPGTIQPAIREGEWIMAVVDSAGQWEPCSRLPKSEYLQLASSGVADKVASENPHFQATDPAIVKHADRLFLELQDKGWLELSDEFYDFDTSPSKGSVDLKVPPATGSQGSAGGGPPGPPGGGGGGGSGKGTGEGAASGGSVGTHDQGRTVESGGRVGLLNVADKTTVGASKSAKFADIRTSQNVEPLPLDAAKSVSVRVASTKHWSALPSMTEFAASVGTGRGLSAGVPITGVKYKSAAIRTKPPEVHDGEPVLRSATGAEVSEMGAKTKFVGIRTSVSSGAMSDDFPTQQGTASAVGDGQPAEFNARLDSGAPSVLCNLNSVGIRTCWGTDLQSEVVGWAEDETCAGAEHLSTGVDAGPVGGADMRERDGGEEWVQVEDGQEELEWKEGGEGAEGEDERSEGGEDANCGDVDNEAKTMEMETQVGIGLSADPDACDVHPLVAAVHLWDVCDEVTMALGRTKTTHRSDINDVTDCKLREQQAITTPSTPTKTVGRVDTDHSSGADLEASSPFSPTVADTFPGTADGGVAGCQHLTSPKKSRVATQPLAVLALPAPRTPMKERREKPAVDARARGACGGIFDNAIAPRVLTIMGDISRGLVPPHHVLSTFGDGQVRITAKDLLTVLLVDGKLNDEVVNFYMALLRSTACMTRQTSSGLRVFSFSSFFFSKLQHHGHSGVERWAKNVDLLHFDMIFVPVHKDNDHWILLSINLRDNVFEISDSYPRVIADSRFYLSVFELIVQYLERHTSHGRSPRSWESMGGTLMWKEFRDKLTELVAGCPC
ncbi:hypothetical protein CBR_g38985 [Chara braunii]|uniref:Ubiquitin-like protease family profile domain-containing protein n=1 Tax=Chara braunii TaxID=69332 RepID=A0A388K139_CHABU|nr:hypothetical protein CBR_g38985 [Chara braunii]|eukprot:GBG63673.1 hypothetical protein CBR_g38985 [Chara braunii]